MFTDFGVLLKHVPALLDGLMMTVVMVAGSMGIGIVIGLVACFGRLSERGPLFWISRVYIDVFRTLPEIVTIFWIYNCLPLLLDVRLSGLAAGLLALSLVAGAFLAEIFRAGILAVPRGQIESAWTLGVPPVSIWFRIILPQAVRMMMPAFIAFLTDLVKASGLLAAISVPELAYQAWVLSGATFRYFEFFTAVGIAYFCLIFPLSMASQAVERRRRMGHR